MTYLIITYTLLHILPILFTVEVHTHPIYREYGVRYVDSTLIISLGKNIWRIK